MNNKNKISVEKFTYALSISVGFVVFIIGIVELISTVASQLQAGSILRDQLSLQVASLIIGMALVNLSVAVRALLESRKIDLIEETKDSGDISGKK